MKKSPGRSTIIQAHPRSLRVCQPGLGENGGRACARHSGSCFGTWLIALPAVGRRRDHNPARGAPIHCLHSTSMSSLIPWWQVYETTRSFSSIRVDTCGAGMPALSVSRATGPTRSWDTTSRSSTKAKPSWPASPTVSCDSAGNRQVRGRRLAASQRRLPLLGQRRHHRPAEQRRNHQRVLEDHSRSDGTESRAKNAFARPTPTSRSGSRSGRRNWPARTGSSPRPTAACRRKSWRENVPKRPSRRRTGARTSSSPCSATS